MHRLTVYNSSLLLLSVSLMVTCLGVFFSSSWQNKISAYLYPNQRTLLASLETSLNVKDHKYKVLKIMSGKKIWIEIYDLNRPRAHAVSFDIDSKADGQMFVNNKTSSLFASDLDGDAIMEIVAPTFGLDFQPQVHAFRLNPKDGGFYRIPTENLVKLL